MLTDICALCTKNFSIRIRSQGPARELFECTQWDALKRGNGWELWNAYAKCFKAPLSFTHP